jgi:hypothetical protein
MDMETADVLEKITFKKGKVNYCKEYFGNHGNKLGGFDGRIFIELLSFFEKYLK